nr:MAG TPA: Pheromone En-6, SIGNALING PROTEIN [Caudoviricetes sp.]
MRLTPAIYCHAAAGIQNGICSRTCCHSCTKSGT